MIFITDFQEIRDMRFDPVPIIDMTLISCLSWVQKVRMCFFCYHLTPVFWLKSITNYGTWQPWSPFYRLFVIRRVQTPFVGVWMSQSINHRGTVRRRASGFHLQSLPVTSDVFDSPWLGSSCSYVSGSRLLMSSTMQLESPNLNECRYGVKYLTCSNRKFILRPPYGGPQGLKWALKC